MDCDISKLYTAVGVAETVIPYGPCEPLLLQLPFNFHNKSAGWTTKGLGEFENDDQRR